MALLIGIIVIARGLPQNHMRLNRATTWTGAGTQVLSRRHQTNEAGWRWPWTLYHTCASSARTNAHASHAQGGNSVRTSPQQHLQYTVHKAPTAVVSPRTGGWVSSAKRLPARRSPLNPRACCYGFSGERARTLPEGLQVSSLRVSIRAPNAIKRPICTTSGFVAMVWYVSQIMRRCNSGTPEDAIRAPPEIESEKHVKLFVPWSQWGSP